MSVSGVQSSSTDRGGQLKIYLANPRSFCAGVVRAIDVVRRAIQVYGRPVYVRHAIVHNQLVVDELTAAGAIFVEELSEVPAGSLVVFSAHGVSPAVRAEARQRGLLVLDATCPLVAKVHLEVARYARDGYHVILVGHREHVEVQGTFGEAPATISVVDSVEGVARLEVPDGPVAYVTQTTLSVDDTAEVVAALKQRWPGIREPAKADICYATQNRQDAVKRLAARCRVIVVVSSRASSNGNRLAEVAWARGCRSNLVEMADEIRDDSLDGDVGITAAASTPEELVQACVRRIQWLVPGTAVQELSGKSEEHFFPLPESLLAAARGLGLDVGSGNARAAARASGNQ
ncbi:MAG: 4-hydroxy-3-methylbut-2-enyl diphosphate reductase [Candidatus Kerfeldbacteria bacterium]|nr:4-hydroxy-3-methylbut-2-enyl diphosphate reductase [Candidatus Kerfeldbacteria bacterium]